LVVEQQTLPGNSSYSLRPISTIILGIVDDEYKNDKCIKLDPASPVWNIKLVGCSENHLRGDSSGKKDTCIGYSPDDKDIPNTQRWSCLPDFKVGHREVLLNYLRNTRTTGRQPVKPDIEVFINNGSLHVSKIIIATS